MSPDEKWLAFRPARHDPSLVAFCLLENTEDYKGEPTVDEEVFLYLEAADFPWMIGQLRALLTELERLV